MINFYLNGKRHELTHLNPNTTVLEYLRLHVRQTDTKEGCGSGDCGACTIMAQRLPVNATDSSSSNASNSIEPFYTLNSCITLLSLMDGHHLMTASYLADNPENHPERALLHPAQQAMVECHGSQCGFCTPGFVMSLASVYENNRVQKGLNEPSENNLSYDDLSYDEIVASISGNLCRCTGYRPIIEAGLAMEGIGQQREANQTAVKDLTINLATDAMASSNSSTNISTNISADTSISTDTNNKISTKESSTASIEPALTEGSRKLFIPQSIEELNQVLAANPKATIWAGGTDLGLSVTQHLVDHEVIIQLSAIEELKSWSLSDVDESTDSDAKQAAVQTVGQDLVFGAGMSYKGMLPVLEQYFPEFAQLFERIASPQIRNMGTIGGNVANASPIGDLPPILLALEARIHLRHCGPDTNSKANGDSDRNEQSCTDEIIPLSEFFLDYKKTKLRAGSYVVAIHIPLMQDNQHLFIHKISKRYEDDISACLVAAKIELSADGTTINQARFGLGGMAAIPLLAAHCQKVITNQPIEVASFEKAAQALPLDVSPLTDVRASREYRLHVVQRLLIKCGKKLVRNLQTEKA
ncbi:xanthine dehydrogenase small subunit [Psychrobacter sp. LV10R520-6]|uniref:xanthine dehydrogenase small subunit n=1 Tax=Psychrobacter sp. LV10R520-6 TaxID=1415574 RepID=UPI0024C79477|nr:FAD binding domain-containing protein [Psychrobacter sp. LV10R520-6]SNT70003.1 xanthine dehydrogenase small subunit [Psychrobacter sp. LV10R520-6]